MKRKRRKRRRRKLLSAAFMIGAALAAGAGIAVFASVRKETRPLPPELLITYMRHIENGAYEAMYEMLDPATSGGVEREAFIQRNAAIYEGIEARGLTVSITEYDEERLVVGYETAMDTAAGEIRFDNTAYFVNGKEGYLLIWNDGLIFPGLSADDKVRVKTEEARRGEIYDRDGRLLAGKGMASAVGIVPGKLRDRAEAVEKVAALLDLSPETVEKKLSAGWVKDDYFVPLKNLPKLREIDLMSYAPEEAAWREKERQDALLAIDGVMISDTEVREYPLKEAAAHLVGYVQNVTAEDLEKHAGEGYTANSVIGRSGAEALFERELKGQNGCEIYIAGADGKKKKTLAWKPVQNGKDVRLTIDARLQQALYGQFREDKGCAVAMNQYTGEVLALVSTPSYDNNAFIFGMTQEEWAALNEDEAKPLYNRFRQSWCPGSVFKPVVAQIGLESGAIDPAQDYGSEGLRWQKDASWGAYYVTTLHDYSPATLENALIYSDNIYFAKAALRIGAGQLTSFLERIGFGERLPFDITMTKSQYSNTDRIGTEIQLADSGYGQGQILVNPLHLACIYTSLCNDGNMIRPKLTNADGTATEVWIAGAFSPETSARVLEGTKRAVNDAHGTGHAAAREDTVLAGKTGTAEIKASKGDASGTELGWFTLFTTEPDMERPLLLLAMTEDVKGRGGSGYVVERVSRVMNEWLDERR